MAYYQRVAPPRHGQTIDVEKGQLFVPKRPILPLLLSQRGEEQEKLWSVCQSVLDASIAAAYGEERQVIWLEFLVGERALQEYGVTLPDDTLQACNNYRVSFAAPGTDVLSLQKLAVVLDLYFGRGQLQHITKANGGWQKSLPRDLVVLSQCCEPDMHWPSGSQQAPGIIDFMQRQLGEKLIRYPETCGFSIRQTSQQGSLRFYKAIGRWLKQEKRGAPFLLQENPLNRVELMQHRWARQELPQLQLQPAHQVIAALLCGEKPTTTFIAGATARDLVVGQLAMLSGSQIGQVKVNAETGHALFDCSELLPMAEAQALLSGLASGLMLLEYLGWRDAALRMHQALLSVDADPEANAFDLAEAVCKKINQAD